MRPRQSAAWLARRAGHPIGANEQPVGAAGEQAALQAWALEMATDDIEDLTVSERSGPEVNRFLEVGVEVEEMFESHGARYRGRHSPVAGRPRWS